jgi:hypothetical protein
MPHDPLGLISFKISSRIASAFEQHPVLHIFITAVIKTFLSVSPLFIENTSLPTTTFSQMKRRSNKHEYGVTTIRDATQQEF